MSSPQALKRDTLLARYGTTEQAAGKVVSEQEPCPQRLKPNSQQCTYRSGEPLRHPKSSATPNFSAACEVVPYPKPICETRSESERVLRRLLPFLLFLVLLGSVLLGGCGGHKPAQAPAPPPPSIPQEQEKPVAIPPPVETPGAAEKIEVPANAKPIFEETGMASWYGAPYHNRRGSNGEVYDMNAMTAAHLALPLGSIVRVTNLRTGNSAVVRITDRGPFVEGRIIDLSLAAAKALDVYLPGIAKVRLEVLQAPAPLDTGGRWAVQIGSFTGEKAAVELAKHLQKRYQTAQVLKFRSPVGVWWVRVRVLDDDRQRAISLARETETAEGAVFLVRLD